VVARTAKKAVGVLVDTLAVLESRVAEMSG
jgi:predicted DNA repair protein MutK